MAKKSYKLTDADFAKMKKVKANPKKYNDNSFHFYLSFNVRLCLLTALIIILGILAFNFYNSSFSDSSVVIAKYEETGYVDNSVIRFDNEILDNGNLYVGDTYFSELVDDIGLDFYYNLKFNKNVKYYYTYHIDGKLSIFNNNKDIIAFKDYEILKNISNNLSGEELFITQNINLDYDFYNNLAKDLAGDGEYNGNLHLIMYLTVNVEDQEFKENNVINKKIETDIPLLSDNVKITSDNFTEYQSFVQNEDSKLVNPGNLFVAVILVIFDTVIALYSISYLINMLPKKSKYMTLRDGLLKDYNKVIVNSKKMAKVGNYNIIDCYSFQELMDAQRLLEKPIIYYEIVKNQKCIFYIIDGNDCYQFILKECDIDY